MKTKAAVATPARKSAPPAYKNPSLPSARRVRDLLSRMTLEEKAAQMLCVWPVSYTHLDVYKRQPSFRHTKSS